ncbi:uncharacterized protein METZ01_LOCUS249625 [marine metagenome]|uniref:Uncharacterized protein n=1 Tax=marine metagenome TaxID=408172 RepID=A0A382IDN3_9ZZZZ
MENTHEFSEINQIRTRCTILESQVEVLQKQNAELKATLTILHPDKVSSTDKDMKWKDIPGIGKIPVDDGTFQV